MSNSKFAKEQLQKYGWNSGSGLGKNEQGMKNPIKVSIKNNKKGVGHDPSKEFTNNWWDKLYDNAANSLQVIDTEGSVNVKKIEKEEKQKEKKALLYGSFIKTSTLTNTEKGSEEIREDIDDSVDTVNNILDLKKYVVSDEDMFSKCGGRTAHKGARHGLKLNGKLKRIEEHETMYLTKLESCDYVKSKKRKKKSKCESDNVDCNKLYSDEISDPSEINETNKTYSKRKSKKLKTDILNMDNITCEPSDINEDNESCYDHIDKQSTKKKKKKKKKKDIDTE